MEMVITVSLLAVYIPIIRINRNYSFQGIRQKVKDQDPKLLIRPAKSRSFSEVHH